jgi:zinc-binding in reverse transcriptase
MSGIDTLLSTDQRIDGASWKMQNSNIFSVGSVYCTLKNGPRIKTTIFEVWKLNVPLRMKVFSWLTLLNKILTIDNRCKRGWSTVNIFLHMPAI